MKITFTEMERILADRAALKVLRAERVILEKRIRELLAGDAATLAKADALFAQSEEVEAKMRGAVPSST